MCYKTALVPKFLQRHCELMANCSFSFACTNIDGGLHAPLAKIHLEKDATIFRNQIESGCIYIILSGILTAFFYLPSGEPVVVGNMGRGQTIGEMDTYQIAPDPYNVKALTPVELCRLSIEWIANFTRRDPGLMRYSLAACQKAAHCLSRQIWVMNAQRIYDRLGRLLAVLCNLGLEKENGVTTIHVSHDDLAFLIHTDRISITRALHKLANEKLVVLDYKSIQIKDTLFARFGEQGVAEMFEVEKLAG